jgi:hypothetical protein
MLHNGMRPVSSLLAPQSLEIATCQLTCPETKMYFVVQIDHEYQLTVFNKIVHQ